MGTLHWTLLVGALAVAGCTRGGDRTEQAQDSAPMMGHMDSGKMGTGHMDSVGMGMGGMSTPGMQMTPAMRAHMDSTTRLSPQQMQATMARHEAMMSRMLDGMGTDMRGMQMTGSPAWNALTDSVKEDLAELPELQGQALSARMRAHADRVQRLLAMHEQMMGK